MGAQVGETAAHLATLRDDDLMRVQRVDQSVLATTMTQTELLLAQAQILAQQQAREARERYEAERQRREALAEWHAAAVRDQAALDAFVTQSRTLAAALPANLRNVGRVDW